jgi:hypothetical protein
MVRVPEGALGRYVCKLTGKLFAFQAEVKGSSPFIHNFLDIVYKISNGKLGEF